MSRLNLSRRGLLIGGLMLSSGLLACAARPGEAQRNLVIIVCRGGMDGLSLAPPVGDPDYERLRGDLAITLQDGVRRLDRDFGLHPSLKRVHGLARQGEARLAPAIASPDRSRSHFQAQDTLEMGLPDGFTGSTGWLNRAIAAAGGDLLRGLSVGQATPLILRGSVQAASWSPGEPAVASGRLPTILQDLYRDDPLMGPAFARGLAAEAMAREVVGGVTIDPNAKGDGGRPDSPRNVGRSVAGFLTAANGPNLATLSLQGFDTHSNQGAAKGTLAKRLRDLDSVIAGLHDGLRGPAWDRTIVVAVTEFGRSASINGTLGTDHGTASAALVMGGGLKPGGLIGDWPTLASGALLDDRDLRPTLDMRSLFKGVLADHMGMDPAVIDRAVFPDSRDAPPLRGLI